MWRLPCAPPSGAATIPTRYLDLVGSVPRWTRFKNTWQWDVDYLVFTGRKRVERDDLEYQPSRQAVNVEAQRIRDYDRPEFIPDEKHLADLAKAVDFAREHFAVFSRGGVMTKEEAVEYVLKSDCADKSPGYPLNTLFKTKAEALSDPVVLADIYAWIDALGTDRVVPCLWAFSLKDEIMRTSKVKDKRTRLFTAAPLAHHVAMVMYFGHKSDALMSDRGTWCSAGREFQHGGWHEMMMKASFGWIFGADAEMYDMSIVRLLFNAAYEVLTEGMDPTQKRVVEDLFAMALDALCVTCRGEVYHKHTGNPSGWYLTLILNTVIMYLLLAMTWIRSAPGDTRADFERAVRAWLCGDDSLVSVALNALSKLNERLFQETWTLFGLKMKKVEAASSIEHLEYCGATSVRIEGRWARKPRVTKFLEALCFTKKLDPLYKLQRACSIYIEMWTVPERRVVAEYVDFLVRRYPWLSQYRRQFELSDARLKNLHLGLEGASRNEDSRQKDRVTSDRSYYILQGRMTKTKSQKARKKAAVAVAKTAGRAALREGGVAQSVAGNVAAAAKKKAKKKGGWWNLLAGAAQMAGELAPMVAPLLAAKHSASATNIALAGGGAASSGGVPLATPAACSTCTGCYNMQQVKGADGRVTGVRIRGMDYLGSLEVDQEVAGTQLRSLDLNPFSSDWNGTQLQVQARLWERYRVKRIVGMVEPACPATTAGQISSFIDPDPDDEFNLTGTKAIQAASAHQGSDVAQLWGMCCAGYAFDEQTQDFYADADGSDARLISPGTWRILANTDMPAATVAGSLYVAYEYEFKISQLESVVDAGQWASLYNAGTNENLPLGSGTWNSVFEDGTLTTPSLVPTGPVGAVNHIYGLPPGSYMLLIGMTGTAMDQPIVQVDGNNYTQNGVPASGGPVTSEAAYAGVIGTTVGTFFFFAIVVQNLSRTVDDGYISIQCPTSASAAPSLANTSVFLASVVPSGVTKRRRTAQQIQREIQAEIASMRDRLMSLEAARPAAAAAAAGIPARMLVAPRR